MQNIPNATCVQSRQHESARPPYKSQAKSWKNVLAFCIVCFVTTPVYCFLILYHSPQYVCVFMRWSCTSILCRRGLACCWLTLKQQLVWQLTFSLMSILSWTSQLLFRLVAQVRGTGTNFHHRFSHTTEEKSWEMFHDYLLRVKFYTKEHFSLCISLCIR